jgi:MFS family permease
MVYPTLLAAIGDVALPSWRASAIGVYRFWRDLGYAIGAVIAGVTADLLGLDGALWIVAGLTFMSGLQVSYRMRETRAPRQSQGRVLAGGGAQVRTTVGRT